MKKLLYISILIVFSSLFMSCEKVIQVDLNKEDPRLVVDAWITDIDSANYISISQSMNYFSNTAANRVTKAEVIILKDDGTSETLEEIQSGVYATIKLIREPLHYYTLSIKTQDGKTYSASAYMPRRPILDSLTSVYRPKSGFFEEGFVVGIWGEEPQDADDWYKFDVFRNDTLLNNTSQQWLITDDKFVSGKIEGAVFPLFVFKPGNWARTDMYSMTKEHYDYLLALQTQLNSDGGMFSPPPANPKGNISNNALGFFGASSVVRKSVFIK